MRISKKPIDPENIDLLTMVAETFEAIAADPDIALEVIEQVAYLSQTRDVQDDEIQHDRSIVFDNLVADVAAAMYENYDRCCRSRHRSR